MRTILPALWLAVPCRHEPTRSLTAIGARRVGDCGKECRSRSLLSTYRPSDRRVCRWFPAPSSCSREQQFLAATAPSTKSYQPKANAFRKFAEVTILLYYSREIC